MVHAEDDEHIHWSGDHRIMCTGWRSSHNVESSARSERRKINTGVTKTNNNNQFSRESFSEGRRWGRAYKIDR